MHERHDMRAALIVKHAQQAVQCEHGLNEYFAYEVCNRLAAKCAGNKTQDGTSHVGSQIEAT